MKQIKLLGMSAFLIWMYSCSLKPAKEEQIKIQDGWKILSENGYSIQYPGDWDLDKSGQTGTSFIVLSQLTSPEDQFREHVNLLIQDLTGMNINLDKYTDISEGQIKRMVNNGNLIESIRLNANGMDFQKVVYTGDLGKFKLSCEQYYWVKTDQAYILTFTGETEQFNIYKEVGEKILNSFTF
jgi:hypothetical protein